MALNKKRRNIISLFLTLTIISLLILSGPVSAIHLSVQTNKAIYDNEESSVTFTITINLETDEQVPIQNVTLDINGTTGNGSATCTFTPDGTELTACTNIEITDATVSAPYENNSGYAYGYGYSSVTHDWGNTSFNYGYNYGYGYGSGNANAGTEFTYTITWDLTAIDASDGTYTAFIDVIAANATEYYIYRATAATFELSRETTTTTTTNRGGGGVGGGGTTTRPNVNDYGASASQGWGTITAGDTINFLVNNPDIPLQELLVTVNNDLTQVLFTVREVINRPVETTDMGTDKVYKYFLIEKSNLVNSDITSAKMNFKVPKAWFAANGVGEGDIALYRFNQAANKWEEYTAAITSSDSNYVYYSSEIPGLSYFAVAQKGMGKKPILEITGSFTAFQIIDAIRAFYEGTSGYSAFDIIDIIRAFYGA